MSESGLLGLVPKVSSSASLSASRSLSSDAPPLEEEELLVEPVLLVDELVDDEVDVVNDVELELNPEDEEEDVELRPDEEDDDEVEENELLVVELESELELEVELEEFELLELVELELLEEELLSWDSGSKLTFSLQPFVFAAQRNKHMSNARPTNAFGLRFRTIAPGILVTAIQDNSVDNRYQLRTCQPTSLATVKLDVKNNVLPMKRIQFRPNLAVSAVIYSAVICASLAVALVPSESAADQTAAGATVAAPEGAAPKGAAPEAAASAPSYSESILKKLSEGVVRIELSNGLRVLLYRRTQAPVFFGYVWVKVGSVNEVAGTTGVSHMLEHMAFKGSTTIGTSDYGKEKDLLKQLDTVLDRVAAQKGVPTDSDKQELKTVNEQLEALVVTNEFSRIYQERGGVSLNAATSKDWTNYQVSLPNVAFEVWCWMESDRLLNPVFRQFYKERAVVGEERHSSVDDSPQGRLYETLLTTAYRTHPNGLPTIGWETDVRRLRVRDIDKLYKTYYRPDNMVVAIVGDIDPATAKPMLEKYFGRLPKADTPLPEVTAIEPPQSGERVSYVQFDAEPQFMMAYHKPVFPHHDDLYFSILHSVLNDGRSSLFQRELIRKKQLATSAYTTEAPGELFPSLMLIGATPRRGVTSETLIDEMQAIIDRIKKEGVSEAELAAAKKRTKVDLINLIDSNEGLAETLGHAELIWGDWRKIFEMYDVMFATTNEDIKRIASAYLNVSNRSVVKLVRPQ